MINPIRKSVLVHTVTHRIIGTTNKYGESTTTDIELTKVRIVPIKRQIIVNSISENDVSTAMMFWDKRWSTDTTFHNNDLIIFEGYEYTIRSIKTFYASINKVHHLEIELK